MIIEIRGTGSRNKGAQLMACAILQHFRQSATASPPRFVVTPSFGSYETRAKLELYSKLASTKIGRTKVLEWLMPSKTREQLGIILAAEIDVILDASGFAFGDKWGPKPAENFAAQLTQWKQPNRKLMLLPQAIGPLTTPRLQRAFRQIQAYADLIFVRDHQSYTYLQELGGDLDRVQLAPDFTLLVNGIVPPAYQPTARDLVIVPNLHMLENRGETARASYFTFLLRAIEEGIQRDLRPVLLFHDTQDRELAAPLLQGYPELTIITEEDPIYLKGIISTAYLLVASRFHALVNGLSQGVPVIGTSWSHKYPMLFEDYGCPQALLATQDCTALPALFDELTPSVSRQAYLNRIQTQDCVLKKQVPAMWHEIDTLIGFAPGVHSEGVKAR